MKFNRFANNYRDELGQGSAIHSSGMAPVGGGGEHSQRLAGRGGFESRRQMERNRKRIRSYRDADVRNQYKREARFYKDDQLHPTDTDTENFEDQPDEQNQTENGIHRYDPFSAKQPAAPAKPKFDIRNGGMSDQVALSGPGGGTLSQGGGYDATGRYIPKVSAMAGPNSLPSSTGGRTTADTARRQIANSRSGNAVNGVGRSRLGQQARDAAYLQQKGHYGSRNDQFRGGTYHSKFEREPMQQHAFREPQHRGYDPYAH